MHVCLHVHIRDKLNRDSLIKKLLHGITIGSETPQGIFKAALFIILFLTNGLNDYV